MSLYKPKNSPYWQFDFRFKGRRFYGSTGQKTKRQAQRIEDAERLKAALGEQDLKQATLDEACGVYWKEVAEMQTSAATTDYQIKNLIHGLGGDLHLTEIRQPDLATFAAKRRAQVSDSSVNREIQLARRIWRFAVKRLEVAASTIDWTALLYREPQERVRELSFGEQGNVFQVLRSDYQALILFAILSGARKSSIIKLRWSDIDLNTATARLQVKGNKYQAIPLTPEMVALISSQPRVCMQVFTYVSDRTRGNRFKGHRYPVTVSGLNKAWTTAVKKSGLQDFRFHDLRHTTATRLLRETGNLKLVQKLLGHSSIETTARYAHVNDADLRNAMSDVDNHSQTIPEVVNLTTAKQNRKH